MDEARTHWKSAITTNPENIIFVPGRILRAVGDDAPGIPNVLYVTVRNEDRRLQNTIMFCNMGFDPDGRVVSRSDQIRDLYDDFKIITYHDLVGMNIECACLGSMLMGIRRVV